MDNNFYKPFNDTDNLRTYKNTDQILTTGLIIGSSLAIATVVSPTVRKITVPTCKFMAKQQLKLLAGIGILSIATYISNQSDDINTF